MMNRVGAPGVRTKLDTGMIFKSFGVKYFVITQIDLLDQREKMAYHVGCLGGGASNVDTA